MFFPFKMYGVRLIVRKLRYTVSTLYKTFFIKKEITLLLWLLFIMIIVAIVLIISCSVYRCMYVCVICSFSHRSCRARGDVKQRNPIFGALGNHVVLRDWIEWLEVHQHLIGLVDTGRNQITSSYNHFRQFLHSQTPHHWSSCTFNCCLSPLSLLGLLADIPSHCCLDRYLCSVFQKRRMTEVRYGLVMGFLWVQLMSCRMS